MNSLFKWVSKGRFSFLDMVWLGILLGSETPWYFEVPVVAGVILASVHLQTIYWKDAE